MRYRLMLAILLVFVSLAEHPTLTSRAQGTTYTDPFAYCAAVGTIDVPDARYDGPKLPEAIVNGLRAANDAVSNIPPDVLITGSSWRCMNGQVYACTVGANLPCEEQANTSRTPTTAMTSYCQAQANTDTLPGFVTGRATVYEWSCQNGVATPGRQIVRVDAQGFLADIWYLISSQGAAQQSLPRSGGSGILSVAMGILLVFGVLLTLLGLVIRRRLAVQ